MADQTATSTGFFDDVAKGSEQSPAAPPLKAAANRAQARGTAADLQEGLSSPPASTGFFDDVVKGKPVTLAPPPAYARPDLVALADAAARRHGVDPALMRAQIDAESSWNPRNVGPMTRFGQAKGIAQFMDNTGPDWGVSDPFDPAQSLEGMARLMRHHLDAYGGDVSKALAAYNAGPGNVHRWQSIPETRAYVAKILKNSGNSGGRYDASADAPPAPTLSGAPHPDAIASAPDALHQQLAHAERMIQGYETQAKDGYTPPGFAPDHDEAYYRRVQWETTRRIQAQRAQASTDVAGQAFAASPGATPTKAVGKAAPPVAIPLPSKMPTDANALNSTLQAMAGPLKTSARTIQDLGAAAKANAAKVQQSAQGLDAWRSEGVATLKMMNASLDEFTHARALAIQESARSLDRSDPAAVEAHNALVTQTQGEIREKVARVQAAQKAFADADGTRVAGHNALVADLQGVVARGQAQVEAHNRAVAVAQKALANAKRLASPQWQGDKKGDPSMTGEPVLTDLPNGKSTLLPTAAGEGGDESAEARQYERVASDDPRLVPAALSMTGELLSSAIPETFKGISDAISRHAGYGAIDASVYRNHASLLTPEGASRALHNAVGFAQYLVPMANIAPIAGSAMSLTGGAMTDPVGTLKSVGRSFNPFEDGLEPEERAIRLANVGLAGLGIARVKGAMTDTAAAKVVGETFGLDADAAAEAVRQGRAQMAGTKGSRGAALAQALLKNGKVRDVVDASIAADVAKRFGIHPQEADVLVKASRAQLEDPGTLPADPSAPRARNVADPKDVRAMASQAASRLMQGRAAYSVANGPFSSPAAPPEARPGVRSDYVRNVSGEVQELPGGGSAQEPPTASARPDGSAPTTGFFDDVVKAEQGEAVPPAKGKTSVAKGTGADVPENAPSSTSTPSRSASADAVYPDAVRLAGKQGTLTVDDIRQKIGTIGPTAQAVFDRMVGEGAIVPVSKGEGQTPFGFDADAHLAANARPTDPTPQVSSEAPQDSAPKPTVTWTSPKSEPDVRAPAPVPLTDEKARKSYARTPGGKYRVGVRLDVVDRSTLLPSHLADRTPTPGYPQEIQPRDRNDAAWQSLHDNARNLDPERLMEDTKMADTGAPIVGPDGAVEAGNGRVIALDLAREKHPKKYKAYQAAVRQWAAEHGLDISAMKDPVLVRTRTTDLTPDERVDFARHTNGMSAEDGTDAEQAGEDRAALPKGLADRFEGRRGSLEDALASGKNRGLFEDFVEALPKARQAKMWADDKPSAHGIERMARAVVAHVLGPRSHDILDRIHNDGDFAPRIMTGIEQAAPAMLDLRRAAVGGNKVAADTLDAMVEALRYVDHARAFRGSAIKWFEQGSLHPRDPNAMRIGKLLVEAKSAREVADHAQALAAGASDSSGGMFGEEQAFHSVGDVVDAAFGDRTIAPDVDREKRRDITKAGVPADGRDAVARARDVVKAAESRIEAAGGDPMDALVERPHGDDRIRVVPADPANPLHVDLARAENDLRDAYHARKEAKTVGGSPAPPSLAGSIGALSDADIDAMLDRAYAKLNSAPEPTKPKPKPAKSPDDRFADEMRRNEAKAAGKAPAPKKAKAKPKPSSAAKSDAPDISAEVAALKDLLGENRREYSAEPRRDLDAMGFYSKLLRTAEEKLPGKASAEQIRKTLLGAGVKPEEMKHTGLDDLLDAGGAVAKADVLAHLRDNAIQVSEVEKKEPDYERYEDAHLLYGTPKGETKYGQYKLPGGENYRELLIVLPTEKAKLQATFKAKYGDKFGPHLDADEQKAYDAVYDEKGYKSSHWDEPNVLAHVRFDERETEDGRRTLHVAEIQSDWHQAGRKHGYRANGDEPSAPYGWGGTGQAGLGESVPDAPFKKTWQELAFKRVLRYAARRGFDALTWDTGATNAERYESGDEDLDQARTDGMAGFYDKILPDFAAKYAKKWGVAPTMDRVKIGAPQDGLSAAVHSLPINATMRASLMEEGQPIMEPRRKRDDSAQGAFDFDAVYSAIDRKTGVRPGTTPKQKALAKRVLNQLRTASGKSQLAHSTMRQLVRRGAAELVGKTIESPEDLAVAAQILRDNEVEAARWFWVKDGRVVGTDSYSFRLPGVASFAPPGKDAIDDVAAWARARMEEVGADGYWLLHNHPSGDPNPSPQDKRTTTLYAKAVAGFRGHLVIDSNRYAVVEPGDDAAPVGSPEWLGGAFVAPLPKRFQVPRDPLHRRTIPSPLIGLTINGAEDVLKIAMQAKAKDGMGLVIATDIQHSTVKSIAEIPTPDILDALRTKSRRALAATLGFARRSGTTELFLVVPETASKAIQAEKLTGTVRAAIEKGVFADVVASISTQGGEPVVDSYRRNLGARLEEGHFLGKYIGNLNVAAVGEPLRSDVDEEKYARALPTFQSALAKYKTAGKTNDDLALHLAGQLGVSGRPYVKRFFQDVRDGKLDDGTRADAKKPENVTDGATSNETPSNSQDGPHVALMHTVGDWLAATFDRSSHSDVTPMTWQELARMADEAFGGSQAAGTYDARDMYDAMEAGLARFAGSRLSRIFDGHIPVTEVLAKLKEVESWLPTQTQRTDAQNRLQQFSTPLTEAYAGALALGDLQGKTALEPSAGTASLAVMMRLRGATVHCNEYPGLEGDVRAKLLAAQGFEVSRYDARNIGAIMAGRTFDVVYTNPPFTADALSGQKKDGAVGADFVASAASLLAPGGRIVAIVGRGADDASPKQKAWFDRMRKGYAYRANLLVDGAQYATRGTTFDNRILVFDRDQSASPVVYSSGASSLADVARATQELGNEHRELPQGEPRGGAPDQRGLSEPGRDGGAVPGGDRLQPGLDGLAGGDVPAAGAPGAGHAGGGRGRADAGADQAGTGAGGQLPLSVPGGRVPEPGGRGDAGPVRSVRTGEAGAGAKRGKPATGTSGQTRGSAGGADVGERPAIEPSRLTEEPGVPQRVSAEREVVAGSVQYHAPFTYGPKHPGVIVESESLAGVPTPLDDLDPEAIQDLVRIPGWITARGGMSDAQIHTVALSEFAFRKEVAPGKPMGMLVGDGTGVGKGRTAVGVVLNSMANGTRRTVWLTANHDELHTAAVDDFNEVLGGPPPFPVKSLDDYAPNAAIGEDEAVLVASYNTLWRAGRYEQVLEWLKGDEKALMLLDEAHKAQGADAEAALKAEAEGDGGDARFSKGKRSKRGDGALRIQQDAPHARVLYLSATAADRVDNLGYAERLGLWGEGQEFKSFGDFAGWVYNAGVSALEIVSRSLKSRGQFIARSLPMTHPDGSPIDFEVMTAQTTPEMRAMWDDAMKVWMQARDRVEQAAADKTMGKMQRHAFINAFYSSHLRFVQLMTSAMKYPTLKREIERALDAGQSIVISLDKTGEAAAGRAIAAAAVDGTDPNAIDYSGSGMLKDLLVNAIDTQLVVQRQDKTDPGKTRDAYVWRHKDGTVEETFDRKAPAEGALPVEKPELVALKNELLEAASRVRVGYGLLDQIVLDYGPETVAELTKRDKQLVYDEQGNVVPRRLAKPAGSKFKGSRLDFEMGEFNRGAKRILVFNDSAAQGVSFHASSRFKNQQQRVHVVAEFGWNTKNEMQKLGRTHRTGEVVGPVYKVLVTDQAAELRFASTIAANLRNLGAVQAGDREASAAGLGDFDLSNKYGEAAGAIVEDWLRGAGKETARKMGVVKSDAERGEYLDLGEGGKKLTRIMNRAAMLPFTEADALVRRLYDAYERVVQAAKSEGEYDAGLDRIDAQSATVLRDDRTKGARLLEIEATIAAKLVPWAKVPGALFTVGAKGEFDVATHPKTGKVVAYRTDMRTDPDGKETLRVTFVRPDKADRDYRDADEFLATYETAPRDAARGVWDAALAATPQTTTRRVNLLTGDVLDAVQRVRDLGLESTSIVVDGERLVGLAVRPKDLGRVRVRLGFDAPGGHDGDAVYTRLMDAPLNTVLPLDGGGSLRKATLNGHPAIRVDGVPASLLERAGAVKITRGWQDSWFVPTDPEKGVKCLDAILKRMPLRGDTAEQGQKDGAVKVPRSEELTAHTPEAPARGEGTTAMGAKSPPAPKPSWSRVQPSPLPGGFLEPLSSIQIDLGKLAGTKVARRAQRRGWLGSFKPGSFLISVKRDNDLATLAHEIGHGLDRLYRLTPRPEGAVTGSLPFTVDGKTRQVEIREPVTEDAPTPFDRELRELWENDGTGGSGGPDVGLDYNRFEGTAEFLRGLLWNPDETRRRFPLMAARYDATVPDATRAAMSEMSDRMRRWYGASSIEKTAAVMDTAAPDEARPGFFKRVRPWVTLDEDGRWRGYALSPVDRSGNYRTCLWDLVRQHVDNDAAPMETAHRIAWSMRGRTLDAVPIGENATVLADKLRYAERKVATWIDDGAFDRDGNAVGPGAVALFECLEPGDYEDAAAYLVAGRVDERADLMTAEAHDEIAKESDRLLAKIEMDEDRERRRIEARLALAYERAVGEVRGWLAERLKAVTAERLDAKADARKRRDLERRAQKSLDALRDKLDLKVERAVDKARAKLEEEAHDALADFRQARLRRLSSDLARVVGSGGGVLSGTDVARGALDEAARDWAPEKLARVEAFCATYRAMARASLQYAVEGGRLTQETVDAYLSRNRFYAAMQRIMESDPDLKREAHSYRTRSMTKADKSSAKAFEGSMRSLRDPVENLLANTAALLVETDRNAFKLAFNAPLRAPEGMRDPGEARRLASIGSLAGAEDAGAVRCFAAGVEEHWIYEPGVREAMEGTLANEVELPWLRPLSRFSRIYREGVTQTLSFRFKNRARDTQEAFLNSMSPIGARQLLARGTTRERRLDAIFGGGVGRSRYLRDGQDFRKATKLLMLAGLAKGRPAKGGAWIKARLGKAVEAYGEMGERSETHTRLAVQRGARTAFERAEMERTLVHFAFALRFPGVAEGFTPATERDMHDYAAAMSRVMIDFRKTGRVSRWISKYLSPFFAANVAGLRANYTAMLGGSSGGGGGDDTVNSLAGDDDGRRKRRAQGRTYRRALRRRRYAKVMLAFLGLALVQRLLVHAAGRDRDYEQMPAYVRDAFFLLPDPTGTVDWIRIPKAWGSVLPLAVGDRLVTGLLGGRSFDSDGLFDTARGAVTPYDAAVADATPTATKVYTEMENNRDSFTGAPIVPPYEAEKYLSQRKGQGRASRAGQAFGRLLGVDARMADHAIQGYTAEMGRLLTTASDVGRADRPGQLGKAVSRVLGIAAENAGSNAADVRWVLEHYTRAKGSAQGSPVSAELKAYREAPTNEEREAARKRLVDRASSVRRDLEARIAADPKGEEAATTSFFDGKHGKGRGRSSGHGSGLGTGMNLGLGLGRM